MCNCNYSPKHSADIPLGCCMSIWQSSENYQLKDMHLTPYRYHCLNLLSPWTRKKSLLPDSPTVCRLAGMLVRPDMCVWRLYDMLNFLIQANVKIVVQKKSLARCLESMSAVLSDCSRVLSTLLDYTKYWIGKVNCGGLFTVTDETFMFIIEKSVQALLHAKSHGYTCTQVCYQTLHVNKSPIILVSSGPWTNLLKMSTNYYTAWLSCITIRGFSIASSWLESSKEVTKSTVQQKSTGLRSLMKCIMMIVTFILK